MYDSKEMLYILNIMRKMRRARQHPFFVRSSKISFPLYCEPHSFLHSKRKKPRPTPKIRRIFDGHSGAIVV